MLRVVVVESRWFVVETFPLPLTLSESDPAGEGDLVVSSDRLGEDQIFGFVRVGE